MRPECLAWHFCDRDGGGFVARRCSGKLCHGQVAACGVLTKARTSRNRNAAMSFTILAILSGEDDAPKESVPSDPGPQLFAPLRMRRGAECAARLQSRDAFELELIDSVDLAGVQSAASYVAPGGSQAGQQADGRSRQERVGNGCRTRHISATIAGRKSDGQERGPGAHYAWSSDKRGGTRPGKNLALPGWAMQRRCPDVSGREDAAVRNPCV